MREGHHGKSETHQSFEKTEVKRGIPKSDGVYVNGYVHGIEVIMTIDTGAERTIISEQVYKKINLSERPRLSEKVNLTHAGGAPLQDFGKCQLEVQLGPLKLMKEVIVAKIEDQVLIGMDILMGTQGKSADVLLSQSKIIIDGVEIPCRQVVSGRLRSVRAADNYTIPGLSERIIDVWVERWESDGRINTCDVMIEHTPQFVDKHSLVLSTSLADLNRATTAKVRVMNPYPTPTPIRENTVVGKAEEIGPEAIEIIF